MSDEITFYHNPRTRGRIARWMLEEVGAPYRVVTLDLMSGEQKSPEFLAINPMGKVPTIVHRGVAVSETGAICGYLGDAFPAAELAPALDDPARGTYLRWLVFAAGCIEPAMGDKLFNRPEVDRPMSIGYGRYEDVLTAIDAAIVPGPYLLGDRFTAADVYFGAILGFARQFGAEGFDRPSFAAYVDRLEARPAFIRAKEADDAAIAAG